MQKRSSSTVDVKFFKLEYDKVLEKLREYAKKCVEKGAYAVILIGSLARGDYTAFSDADIIIICDNVPQRFIDRLTEFIDPSLPIDIEPRVYTREEILKMAKEKARIVKEILSYGKLLAGNEDIINEIRKAFEEIDHANR